uniref:Uncharacterized protein n=1 Tax=Rhizophagus irregularis (strain DAOM 181602 / DAOM 197198 / MUCL 43194) TaxID=747089 RepID=U9UD64_RHIID
MNNQAIITHLDNRISKNPTAILNVSSSSLKDGSGMMNYYGHSTTYQKNNFSKVLSIRDDII